MSVGSISGAPALPASPSPAAAQSSSTTPKVDNDGDFDNGADDQTSAQPAGVVTVPSDPNRGQVVNTKA